MNKVIAVKPKDNYILLITLSNGTSGEFDASPYLEKGIFNDLKTRIILVRFGQFSVA